MKGLSFSFVSVITSFVLLFIATVSSQVLDGVFKLRDQWTGQFGGEINVQLNETYYFGWVFYVQFDIPVKEFVIDETILIGEHPDHMKYAFKHHGYNRVLHNPASGERNFQCRGKSSSIPVVQASLIPLAYDREDFRVALNRAILGITEPPTTRTITTTTPLPTTTASTVSTTLGEWWTRLSTAAAKPTTEPRITQRTAVSTTPEPPNLGDLNLRYNLRDVITKSLLFFEAQRSGLLPENNRIPWRSHSMLRDGTDSNVDLSGGYFVDGGYVKYGFPMAFATTQMAWSLLESRDAYLASHQIPEMMSMLKWATDYFIKCHVSKFEFYGQVSTTDQDDKYWGRPEDFKQTRSSFKITKSKPGSDLAAETAAALAATSMVFNETNSTYSKLLLDHAKDLYTFADKYRGKYHDSIKNAKNLYKSWSGFWDELAWGAVWLYKATGEQLYLDLAKNRLERNPFTDRVSTFNWDDKRPGVSYLLAQITKEDKYKYQVTDFCNSMLTGGGAKYTPQGLLYISEWGPNRHAANVGFICLLAAKLGIRSSDYRRLAHGQLSYILGDGGRSYVIGFGTNSPQKTHHKASSCPNKPAPCSWADKDADRPNPQKLVGAMVAGPDKWDYFLDTRNDFKYNIVALDFNAALQSLAAGILELQVTGQTFSEPNPEELKAAVSQNYAVGHDYDEVLRKSLLFYEAQRSGKLPDDNRIPWRNSSFLNDRGNNGEDLTGGYFDAGDYVKFNFPMAYTTTILAWGIIQYPEAYTSAGEMDNARDAIKWATDYFIKCHVSKYELYAQVGSGTLDHSQWTRPSGMMSVPRPAHKLTKNKPGSEVVAETAAAMAATSIVFRNVDPSYTATLLGHARDLLDFAVRYREKYHRSIPGAMRFYRSYSGYKDELAWASTWMYLATNQTKYLTQAKAQYRQIPKPYPITEGFFWDRKTAGVQLLLAQITNNPIYTNAVKQFCDGLLPGGFGRARYTPRGLLFLQEWGPLRHAAGVSLICLGAANLGIEPEKYRAFAKRQIHYMLGDSGLGSYVVGYGPNPPTRPHHRASSCPLPPARCDWGQMRTSQSNAHVLYGALIGGPDQNDQFSDDRTNHKTNEVAIDYNAAFQSAVAALKYLELYPPATTTPDPSLTTTTTTTPAPSTTPPIGEGDYTTGELPGFDYWYDEDGDIVSAKSTSAAPSNLTSVNSTVSPSYANVTTTTDADIADPLLAAALRCELKGITFVIGLCDKLTRERPLKVNTSRNVNQTCRWESYRKCVNDKVGRCTQVWNIWKFWNQEGDVPHFEEAEQTCQTNETTPSATTTPSMTTTTAVPRTTTTAATAITTRGPLTRAPPVSTSSVSTVSQTPVIIQLGSAMPTTVTSPVITLNECLPMKLFQLCSISRAEFPNHVARKQFACRFSALKACAQYNGKKCDDLWASWDEWNNGVATNKLYFTEKELRCREKEDNSIATCQYSGIMRILNKCFNEPDVVTSYTNIESNPRLDPRCRKWRDYQVCVNRDVAHCRLTWYIFKHWNGKSGQKEKFTAKERVCSAAAAPSSGTLIFIFPTIGWLLITWLGT